MIISVNKNIFTSLVVASMLVFTTSANAAPPKNSATKPVICGKKPSKNCVDKRDFLKQQYQEYMKKIDLGAKNPTSKAAKLSKVAKSMERAYLEECDFDASQAKSKPAADAYLYNCQVATYGKLIRKIESHPDLIKAK